MSSQAVTNPERKRYLEVYKKAEAEEPYFVSYSRKKYGHVNPGRHYMSLLLQCESVLDVGCGHNRLALTLRKSGVSACGVDFASPAADVIADMLHLPFFDKQWDMVTAFDVLEHLRPEQVQPGIMELRRVSRRFLFKISYRASAMTVNGQNLHPTVHDQAWWKSRLYRLAKFDDEITRGKESIAGVWK